MACECSVCTSATRPYDEARLCGGLPAHRHQQQHPYQKKKKEKKERKKRKKDRKKRKKEKEKKEKERHLRFAVCVLQVYSTFSATLTDR